MKSRIGHKFWCPEPRLVCDRDLPVDALLELPRAVFDPRDCSPPLVGRRQERKDVPAEGQDLSTENVC